MTATVLDREQVISLGRGELGVEVATVMRSACHRRRRLIAEAVRRATRDRYPCTSRRIGEALEMEDPLLDDPCVGAWLEHIARSPADVDDTVARAVLTPAQDDLPTVELEPGFNVALDDRTAARHIVAPTPTGPLDDEALGAWRAHLTTAWERVVQHHGRWAPGVRPGLDRIIQQATPDPLRHVSSSSRDAFGVIGLSDTEDVRTLAVAIVHEVQHVKLGGLLEVMPVHRADSVARHHVAWREVPRPFEAFLQGIIAFTAVADFWRTEVLLAQAEGRQDPRADHEYFRWAPAIRGSLREAAASGVLEPAGVWLLQGLQSIADEWGEPLPETRSAQA